MEALLVLIWWLQREFENRRILLSRKLRRRAKVAVVDEKRHFIMSKRGAPYMPLEKFGLAARGQPRQTVHAASVPPAAVLATKGLRNRTDGHTNGSVKESRLYAVQLN